MWSVYTGLRSLPCRVYLVAMWILCDELRELYAPWIGVTHRAALLPFPRVAARDDGRRLAERCWRDGCYASGS